MKMRWGAHKVKEGQKCIQKFGLKDLRGKAQLECVGEHGGCYRNDSCINI
jgi:hypothetical protein